jgi:hypothetical protein
MKRYSITICIAVCGFLVSCSQSKYVDSSALILEPGIGIANVVAVGLTLSDVKEATGDLTIEKYEPNEYRKYTMFEAYTPSLGAELTVYEKTDNPINSVTFWADPAVLATNDPRRSFSPFCGTLSCGISFEKPRSVRRADIIKAFGEPLNSIDATDPERSRTHSPIDRLHSLWAKGQSTSIASMDETESINYPELGIEFVLDHGIVNRIGIINPFKAIDATSQ